MLPEFSEAKNKGIRANVIDYKSQSKSIESSFWQYHINDIILIMAIIKPISDLRNKSNEISSLAHETQEPIFITKNGEGDLVVLSIQEYRRRELKLDLFTKLSLSQAQLDAGEKGKPFQDVLKTVRNRIDEKKS